MKTDILLFDENCGSSWLCDLIGNAENVAHIDFEPLCNIINTPRIDYGTKEYLDSLLLNFNIDTYIAKRMELGFSELDQSQVQKLMSAEFFIFKARGNEFPPSYFNTINRSSCRFIFLKRKSTLKQIVSIYKRRVIGISHFNNFEITAPIKIEEKGFFCIAKELEVLQKLNNDLYDSLMQEKFVVYYEDLVSNLESQLDLIAKRMNYSYIPRSGYFKKITNEKLHEAVINFEEVNRWYELIEINFGLTNK
jgi:hypothetical protein